MIFKNPIEEKDTKKIVESKYINWDFFKNSTVLITGATGLIGFQTVLSFLYVNEKLNSNIKILALVRNLEKAEKMFGKNKTENLKFVVQKIEDEIKIDESIDFIIHTANSTSSKSFVEEPYTTINSIVIGTKNIIDLAENKKIKGMIYLSSMEVYGNIPLDKATPIKEDEYGYLDILKQRSSYPEGKRLAEAMCSMAWAENKTPVKIARLCQTIGAGVDYNDNRVFAQFARNIAEKKNIVLQTKGETVRSYCYITDCIAALLNLLEKGKNGESYNVANEKTTCSIYEMAKMLCDTHSASKLIINEQENQYYQGTVKYCLDTTKIKSETGWMAEIDLKESYDRLINSFCCRI